MTLCTDPQQEAWRALFRVQARARRNVDQALKEAGLPSLEVYDVLLELDRADATGGLIAKDLEHRLLLPQYGVSRLMDRLEKQRLLERRDNPDDHRSSLIFITGSGREMRRRMWLVYGAEIARFFDRRLRPGQVARLTALLALLQDAG